MCLIDCGTKVSQVDDNDLSKDLDATLRKLQTSPLDKKLKRKLRASREPETKHNVRDFKENVLFVGYLSKGSLLVMEKPWSQVVRTLDAPPVHRHIYGT